MRIDDDFIDLADVRTVFEDGNFILSTLADGILSEINRQQLCAASKKFFDHLHIINFVLFYIENKQIF